MLPSKNIGPKDRLIRFLLAIVLLAGAAWSSSWILLGLGLFCLFEAVASWCIMYQLFGWNSCPLSKR